MPERFVTLEDAARVAGHARWLETRLFEIVGGWVTLEPDPAVKALLSRHSFHHAWHAEVWRDRLPRVAHLDPDALTVPAGPSAVALVEALEATTAPGQTVERLVALARVVLPRMVAAYQARVGAAHPLADGPTVRWLAHLLAEETTGLAEAEAGLAAVLEGADPEVAGRASAHEASLGATTPGGAALIGLVPLAEA